MANFPSSFFIERCKIQSNIHVTLEELRSHRGVMVTVDNCGLEVSEFELQSCYYANFRTNTQGKGIGLPLFPLQLFK